MNPEFTAWLLSHGFTQKPKSCTFWRVCNGEAWYVWLHKNGGQAEIMTATGHRVSRCESWKSTEQLVKYFGKGIESQ